MDFLGEGAQGHGGRGVRLGSSRTGQSPPTPHPRERAQLAGANPVSSFLPSDHWLNEALLYGSSEESVA